MTGAEAMAGMSTAGIGLLAAKGATTAARGPAADSHLGGALTTGRVPSIPGSSLSTTGSSTSTTGSVPSTTGARPLVSRVTGKATGGAPKHSTGLRHEAGGTCRSSRRTVQQYYSSGSQTEAPLCSQSRPCRGQQSRSRRQVQRGDLHSSRSLYNTKPMHVTQCVSHQSMIWFLTSLRHCTILNLEVRIEPLSEYPGSGWSKVSSLV